MKLKIKHPKKFYTRVGLVLLILLLPLVLWLLVKALGKPETALETAMPETDISTPAETGEALRLYQGPFIDATKLPAGLKTVEGKQVEYPEAGVRGIYLTAFAMGNPTLLEDNLALMQEKGLNALVIDFKDDYGYVRVESEAGSPKIQELTEPTYTQEQLVELKERGFYLIARIVAFRDPALAQAHPELAFQYASGELLNTDGQAFVNPLLREVWEYNVELAEAAIEAGFDEVQFDYVRFAEGFELAEPQLTYDRGEYADNTDLIKRNQQAVSDFIAYARERINAYGVKLSVDIFGYVAFDDQGGIGQAIEQILPNIDVLSSMIYPSHWGFGYFGIDQPDTEPYQVVKEYITKEKELFAQLESPPISRPWIQAFSAPWLGPGNYLAYGKAELEAQIKALSDAGIHEYLLWRANNNYRIVYEDGEK